MYIMIDCRARRARAALAVLLDLEDLVLDRHRLERADLERHLVGDSEQPEVRPRGSQELRVPPP